MTASPAILAQPAQSYVGITRAVSMTTINEIADRIPEIIEWLTERGIALAGAPFLRYLVIDMPQNLTVEAGVPVSQPVDGDDVVHAGTLPEGRYATVTHRGSPDGLKSVTAALLDWATDSGTALDMSTGTDGEHWACRLETYLTHPADEPDLDKWVTTVAIKLAE